VIQVLDLLIVDDDAALCRSLELQLREAGHRVRTAGSAAEGLERLAEQPADAVFLDITLPDRSGLDVLEEILETRPELPVIMITGRQDMSATIRAMQAGAYDYLRKPFDLEEILLLIDKIRRSRKQQAVPTHPAEAVSGRRYEIVGRHRSILEVLKQIGLLSRSKVTVLLEGESGTGKEMVARALHEARSPGEPFVALNCSAIVPDLGESELFGHEQGAFTGAHARKIGKLEFAGEGTLFLDEIGDMPLDLQAKLLRVLQEREFERVGGLRRIPYRARTIAASHRNLAQMVKEGTFREDLFYRLSVATIRLPPLRERREDIPLLARHLLSRIARELHREIDGITDEAMRRLQAYDWPGNVRELENVLTRAAALSQGHTITAEQLFIPGAGGEGSCPSEPPPQGIEPLHAAEKRHVLKALQAFDWNITHTARALEISPTTLRKKIADYKLSRPPR
jgi:two-component system response regulator AtoC